MFLLKLRMCALNGLWQRVGILDRCNYRHLVLFAAPLLLGACGQTTNGGATATTSTTTSTVVGTTTTTTLPGNIQAIVAAINKLPVSTTYPNFVAAKTGAVNGGAGCPSSVGVDSSAMLTTAEAAALENSIYTDLAAQNTDFITYFDRAMLDTPHEGFAQLFAQSFGTTFSGLYSENQVGVERLSGDSSLASAVNSACGSVVVDASWRVIFCGTTTYVSGCDPGLTTTELLINRNGKWLIWYLGSGLQ